MQWFPHCDPRLPGKPWLPSSGVVNYYKLIMIFIFAYQDFWDFCTNYYPQSGIFLELVKPFGSFGTNYYPKRATSQSALVQV